MAPLIPGFEKCFAYVWNLESGTILPVESEILGIEIQNTAQGMRNPSSTDKESGFQHWIPESNGYLEFPYMERKEITFILLTKVFFFGCP